MPNESEILATMEAYAAARINGDLDAILDFYSEDWEDSKGFRKSSLKESYFVYTVGAKKTEIKIDLSEGNIIIEGDRATCSPVSIHTPKGSVTYS